MPEALGILNYFDTHEPTDNGLTIRLRRLPPTFLPITWNIHFASLSLQDLHTQTTFVNHGLSYRNLIRHAHPCVWTSINAIHIDQAAASTTLYQH